MTLTLRQAEPEDAERLDALKRACFSPAYLDLSVFRSPRSVAYLRALASPELRERHPILIAGEFEGYVQAVAREGTIHLNYIGVHSNAGGRGLGRHLLAAFQLLGQSKGCATATLDVFASNARAIEWYLREGYIESARSEMAIVDLVQVAPEASAIGYEGLGEALAEERQRGFAMVHSDGGEVGLVAGDTLRPRLPLDPEPLARAMRGDFPERTRMILVGDVGDLPLLDRQTSVRMEKRL